MHPNPRIIAPIVMLIVIIGGAGWYFTQAREAGEPGALSASGTIEGTQIVIAPELGGRVLEVLVSEGDTVKMGQKLVRFDDTLLLAQLEQAIASLQIAQANYDLAAKGPADEQRQLAIASAELELINAQQDLQALYENRNLTEAQFLQSIAAFDKARDTAQQYLENIIGDADPADIDAAWASVIVAQDKVEKAQEDFAPYEKKAESNLTRAILLGKLAAAQQVYDSAVYHYNNLIGTSNQYVLAVAEADVAVAKAKLEDAKNRFSELENGIDPDVLSLAQARLTAAEANLALANAGTTSEQLSIAQAQVDAAQTSLDVCQTQIDKLEILAPIDAVVLTRSAEPGEFLVPGAPLLTLIRLDDLKISVYIPEDQYGLIRLGQHADVMVDSYPGERFEGTVVRISDQAEFTPRNVQTEEGRRTTVFAVELSVVNPEGNLKPGMPADVEFDH